MSKKEISKYILEKAKEKAKLLKLAAEAKKRTKETHDSMSQFTNSSKFGGNEKKACHSVFQETIRSTMMISLREYILNGKGLEINENSAEILVKPIETSYGGGITQAISL